MIIDMNNMNKLVRTLLTNPIVKTDHEKSQRTQVKFNEQLDVSGVLTKESYSSKKRKGRLQGS